MVLKILIGVAIVIVIFAIVVATRPAAFHIERSITIAAPPRAVFEQVNDFRAWTAWSPWEKIDPNLQRTYGGPPNGVGTTYAWVGNKKVGEGRMTIEKSDSPSSIAIKLEFVKPFAATNVAAFTFSPTADGTRVTWAMDGRNNFVCKAFSLFMGMDKMVGGDFERGLAALKTVAEGAPSAGAAQPVSSR
jgi:uncharacterized protein YndB with AHSA1/START domain